MKKLQKISLDKLNSDLPSLIKDDLTRLRGGATYRGSRCGEYGCADHIKDTDEQTK